MLSSAPVPLATSEEALRQEGWRAAGKGPGSALESGGWTSPSGQQLRVIRSSTEPPFYFAYNPGDSDMRGIRDRRVVEPALTDAWRETVGSCCARRGTVIDVGANFGWYTLLSLSLGCRVAAFEPIAPWREAIRLGVALNGPSFAERLRLIPAVVYHRPGTFVLSVPEPSARNLQMGATTMDGTPAAYKRVQNSRKQSAPSVRLDELGPWADVCMLKADVEGNEPQVLLTATHLLSSGEVRAVQLEVTRSMSGGTHRWERQNNNQTCAIIQTLEHLRTLGYGWQMVPWSEMHRARAADALRPFPSRSSASAAARMRRDPLRLGYLRDFMKSTNLLATRETNRSAPLRAPGWPALACPVGPSPLSPTPRDVEERASVQVSDCFGPYECG